MNISENISNASINVDFSRVTHGEEEMKMQEDIKEEMRVNLMDFCLTVISFPARTFRHVNLQYRLYRLLALLALEDDSLRQRDVFSLI